MTKSLARTLFIIQFLMLLALEMGNPFLPLFIAHQNIPFDKAAFYSALAFTLPMIANILMGPLWGILANRIGYKKMLMRAALTLVITQGLMIFANSISAVLIIRFIQGGFAGFIAAMQMYVLSLNITSSKTQQLGHLQFSKALATSMAGLIGGSLLSLLDFKGLFLVAMALCLTATFMIYKKLPTTEKAIVSIQKRKQFLSIHSFFHFINLGLLITLTQIVKFLPEPIFILSISASITHNTITLGLLYSMPAIGLFLSSNYCSKQFDQCREVPKKIKTYLVFYSSLGILIMLGHAFFSHYTILLILIRLLWGIVLAALLPALFCLMSDRFQHQGLAIGWANTFAKIGNLIGIGLGGFLGSYIAITYLFILLASVYALIAFISLCFNTSSIAAGYTNQQTLSAT
ncbi:MFS transporter [Legionella sp. CNM-1927-20]|uniref:MFS transporter n=1 Tax=Legionella sp. CNM-1927-20 TaxID=3422221 RepID=UPI00403B1E29